MNFCADIEMECLATWKDGSETYLYARLTGAQLHSRDERFRCFVRCFITSTSLINAIAIFGRDAFTALPGRICRQLRTKYLQFVKGVANIVRLYSLHSSLGLYELNCVEY